MRLAVRPRLLIQFIRLSIGAVVTAFAAASAADAQTVIVRSAPAGSAVEVTMNGGTPATATTDQVGDASLGVNGRTADMLVQVYVDVCGTTVRVHLVERGLQTPATSAGCTRTEPPSVFAMRPATTFVIDIAGENATVHLSQGPPPPEWVEREGSASARFRWAEPPTGLVVSAGAGFSGFSKIGERSCGDAPSCVKNGAATAFSLGVGYWIRNFAAVEVGYARPGAAKVSGSGDNYRFSTNLDSRLITIAGKAGVRVGTTRLYGFGGVNRHEATITTTQTVDDATVTVGGATQTVKGGTQQFAQKTRGWNWLAGGGLEGWVTPWIGIYGEFTRAKLKGEPTTGGEGGLDDQATLIAAGIRLHIGR